MSATETMDRQSVLDLVETTLVGARKDGKDLSPTELHEMLAPDHPEIAAMSKPKFSAGFVRVIKQKLNDRPHTVNGRKPTRIDAGSTAEEDRNFTVDRDQLRVALFDFASEMVHTDSAADRIAKLQNIEEYVDRVIALIDCQ